MHLTASSPVHHQRHSVPRFVLMVAPKEQNSKDGQSHPRCTHACACTRARLRACMHEFERTCVHERNDPRAAMHAFIVMHIHSQPCAPMHTHTQAHTRLLWQQVGMCSEGGGDLALRGRGSALAEGKSTSSTHALTYTHRPVVLVGNRTCRSMRRSMSQHVLPHNPTKMKTAKRSNNQTTTQ